MPTPTSHRRLFAAAITFACLLLPAGTASAQSRVALGARAGIAVPAGELADLVAPGATVGGGIAVRVYRDLWLRFGLNADMLEEKRLSSGEMSPGVNLYHYLVDAEWRFTSAFSPFSVTGTVGAGTTRLEIEAFAIPQGQPGAGQTPLIQESYPALHAGVQLGYRLGRRVEAALSVRAYRVFANEEDTAAIETLSDEVDALGAVWTIPIALHVDLWF